MRQTPPDSERGFTLVELVTVVGLIGTLAAIGVPLYERARIEAKATSVANDVHELQTAVVNYSADGKPMGCAPAPAPGGAFTSRCHPTAEDLGPYLPPGFLRQGVHERYGVKLAFETYQGGFNPLTGTINPGSGSGQPQVVFKTETLEGIILMRALRGKLSGGKFSGLESENLSPTAPNPRYIAAQRAIGQLDGLLKAAAPGSPAATRLAQNLAATQQRLSQLSPTSPTPIGSTFTYRFVM